MRQKPQLQIRKATKTAVTDKKSDNHVPLKSYVKKSLTPSWLLKRSLMCLEVVGSVPVWYVIECRDI